MARFHELEVIEVRPETEEAVTVRLAVPETLKPVFAYRAGQHLIVKATLDGDELRRTYSICAAEGEPDLRLCVRHQPRGRFSAFVNRALKPGCRLAVMPPAGRFTVPLQPEARRLHVAFSAGSGITPILSLLKTTLRVEPQSRFVLVHGSRSTDTILFREELADLKDRHPARLAVLHVLSREPQDVPLLEGRIDAAKVRAVCRGLAPPALVDAWYLCGPAPMIGLTARTLAEAGVVPERIHFEYFTPEGNAPRPRPADEPPPVPRAGVSRVTAILDGRRLAFDLPFAGPSLLEAARAAGADAPFACKAGVCSTCRARVVEGRVTMAANYALEEAEVAAGFVLTCQARPLTERVTVDYDAR